MNIENQRDSSKGTVESHRDSRANILVENNGDEAEGI
jgi:hypothetical protein